MGRGLVLKIYLFIKKNFKPKSVFLNIFQNSHKPFLSYFDTQHSKFEILIFHKIYIFFVLVADFTFFSSSLFSYATFLKNLFTFNFTTSIQISILEINDNKCTYMYMYIYNGNGSDVALY